MCFYTMNESQFVEHFLYYFVGYVFNLLSNKDTKKIGT